MVFSLGRQRLSFLNVSVQLLVFTGCGTVDLFSSEATAQRLRLLSANPDAESSAQVDLEDDADAAHLTALLSSGGPTGDKTNIISTATSSDSSQRHTRAGLLETDQSLWHTSPEGDNPERVGPLGAAAEPPAQDSQGAVVQVARTHAALDWMQLHHSAAHALNLPECPLDCYAEWLGDGWCDSECNLEACNLDGGDCEGWCGGECRPQWPGDGECDLECFKEECQWDGGDCPEWEAQKLPSASIFEKHVETYMQIQLTAEPAIEADEIDRRFLEELYKSGVTSAPESKSAAESPANGARAPKEDRRNEASNSVSEGRQQEGENATATAEKDGEETDSVPAPTSTDDTRNEHHKELLRMIRRDTCECDVKEGKLGNGVCNPECNSYACHFDGFDCHQMCSAECPNVWLGDGKCDKDCDVPECFHDKGDCWECAPDCRLWMIGNNICDGPCNTANCWFDHGDCNDITKVLTLDYTAKPYVYQFCARDFIGDGKCDENCFNEESAWDGGDCDRMESAEGKAAEGPGQNPAERRIASESTV